MELVNALSVQLMPEYFKWPCSWHKLLRKIFMDDSAIHNLYINGIQQQKKKQLVVIIFTVLIYNVQIQRAGISRKACQDEAGHLNSATTTGN